MIAPRGDPRRAPRAADRPPMTAARRRPDRRRRAARAPSAGRRSPHRRGPSDTAGGAVSLYRDEGVVLRTMRLGEADRIVTLMTKEPRQGARRGQGRAPDHVQVRRPPRAAQPRGHAVLAGPGARHRQPGRGDRRLPGGARGPGPGGQGASRSSRWSTSSPRSAMPTPGSTTCWWARFAPWPTPTRALARARRSCLKALALDGSAPVRRPLRDLRGRPRDSSPSTSSRAGCCAGRAGAAGRSSPEAHRASCAGSSAAASPRRCASRQGPLADEVAAWPRRPWRSTSTAGCAASTLQPTGP